MRSLIVHPSGTSQQFPYMAICSLFIAFNFKLTSVCITIEICFYYLLQEHNFECCFQTPQKFRITSMITNLKQTCLIYGSNKAREQIVIILDRTVPLDRKRSKQWNLDWPQMSAICKNWENISQNSFETSFHLWNFSFKLNFGNLPKVEEKF